MSDSDEDEFAAQFDESEHATTPFRITRVAGNARVNGHAVAGPSKPTAAPAVKKRRKRSPSVEIADGSGSQSAEEQMLEKDVEVEEVPPPRTTKTKGRPGRPPNSQQQARAVTEQKTTRTRSGQTQGQGKGKERQEPGVIRSSDEAREVIEIDAAQEDRGSADKARRPAVTKAKGPLTAQRQAEERLRRELELVRKERDDFKFQRDALAAQLQEVHVVGTREAEQSLDEHISQYKAQIQAQQDQIQELIKQLAIVDKRARQGKTSHLQILTREDADQEKRAVEDEVQRLTDTLKEKDALIAHKDGKIYELRETNLTLESDLKAEIEHNKALTSRSLNRDPPSSSLRNGKKPLVTSDPKHDKVVRLYEDITNLLVLNVKDELNADTNNMDTIFRCLWSHASGKCINFELRTYVEYPDITDLDSDPVKPIEPAKMVMYKALEVDHQDDAAFMEGLGFLADSFTFEGNQMDRLIPGFTVHVDRMLGLENGDELSYASEA